MEAFVGSIQYFRMTYYLELFSINKGCGPEETRFPPRRRDRGEEYL